MWTEELEDPSATAERGYRFLRFLAKRQETDIVVVGHGGFFNYLFNTLKPRVVASAQASRRFGNAELRSLSMTWSHDKSGEPRMFKFVDASAPKSR